jgi:hypothetical protein
VEAFLLLSLAAILCPALVGRLTQILPLTNALRPGTIWTMKAAKRRERRETSPAAFVSFVPFAHFAV